MKCDDCPFHLVCYMGRLGGEDHTGRALCPECGKLQILDEETRGDDIVRVYQFFCEQRPATPDARSTHKLHRMQARNIAARSGGHEVAETSIKDPVDDTLLKIGECLVCGKSPLARLALLRIIDMDAEWEDEERRKRHVFRLRTARENKK